MRTALRLLTTAALAATCVILSVLLWQARREIQAPPPAFGIALVPVTSPLEIRGGAGAEGGGGAGGAGAIRSSPAPGRQVFRPPRGHRVVLTLELPSAATAGDPESRLWAAEILPPTGEGAGYVQRATALFRGAVQVDVGSDPPPGQYRVHLYRFTGQDAELVARYGYRIGVPEEVPPEEGVPAAPAGSGAPARSSGEGTG